MKFKTFQWLSMSLGLWWGLLAGPVWADELPLRILLANDPAADYASDQPAVALFQNLAVGDNSEAAIKNWVKTTFGAEFSHVYDAKSPLPSGVISRFSIAKYGVWNRLETKEGDGRSLYALIDLSGKKNLWVINTHLSPEPKQRLAQANDLLEHITAETSQDDYLVVGGQLNITDINDPALEVLQAVLQVEGPLLIKQEDGDVYDWLLTDADLASYRFAQAQYAQNKSRKLQKALDLERIRRELYRLIKDYRIDLSGYFQPPPPVTLDNAVTVEGAVSPQLLRNHREYRFTPTGPPALRSLHIEMESAGPGDADLQLAYWSNQYNQWVFYANQATPGTSNESVTITNGSLLNREWRILVEYSGGSSAPYRLRAFSVYDLQRLHGLNHLTRTGDIPPPGPVADAPSQNVQPGGWQFYALDVPANAADLLLEVTRTGGGEAHVYVQKDAPPWFNNALIQLQNSNIVHTLSLNSASAPPLSAGTWYFGIHTPGPQDADFNLSTTLSCCAGPPPVVGSDILLANGVLQTGSVWFGDWQYYTLTLPTNATHLEITLTGNGPGDADLYYGGSQPPTLGVTTTNSRRRGHSQEYLAYSIGSPWGPLPGPWPQSVYIGVYGYSAAAYAVTATWSDPVTTQTLPGGGQVFSMQNFYVYDPDPLVFAIQVPAGALYRDLRIAVQTPDDVVLYVRRDNAPDKLNFDFSAGVANGPEIIVTPATTPALTAGTWWFAVYSNNGRSNITEIRAELRP